MRYVRRRRMWSIMLYWSVTLCFSLAAINLGQADSHIQSRTTAQSEEAILRVVVDRYLAAYGKKDLAGITALWGEGSPNLALHKESLLKQFAVEDLNFGRPAISRVKVEGDTASLRMTAALTSIDLKSQRRTEQRLTRNIEFVKQGGEWRLWRYASATEDLATAIIKADSEAEQAKLLAEEKELVTAELGRALLMQGERLSNQGDYARAAEICDLVAHIAERLGDKRIAASALRGSGITQGLRGDYTRAMERHQQSLRISEEIGDKIGAARTMNNMGNTHQDRGDYTQALEAYQSSLKIKMEIGDQAGVSLTLNNIGNVYKEQGDYVRAMEQYQKSLKTSEEIGDRIGLARTLNNMGNVHQAQGDHVRAMECYQQSLKIAEETGNQFGIAGLLNNMGNVHKQQGAYAQALERYQAGLKIFERISDQAGVSLMLNDIGDVHQAQGEYVLAMEYYQKSLKIAEEIGNKPYIALALNNLAIVHYAQNNYTQALQLAERAANIAAQIGLRDHLSEARTTAGNAYFALNQLSQARLSFNEAIGAIETMRDQIAGGAQEQQRFFESRVAPYQDMVGLLIAQNDLGEALTYAERAKARVLLDILSNGRANISKAMTSPEQEQERRLNGQLTSLNSQIYREHLGPQPDSARLAHLEAQLQKARLDFEAFQASLYATHPELRTHRGEDPPLKLEQAYALLPDAGAAVLEFVVTENKTYLFALTKSAVAGVKVYPLDIKQKDLADRVGRFHQMLSASDNRFSRSAHDLYDLLLKPAATQLRGKNRLLIVPDDSLWELPFQALQSPQDRYLIDDYTISYAPSLSVLREMVNARRAKEARSFIAPTVLALGNPALGPQTAAKARAALMGERLDPLPEAERQVQALKNIYGAGHSKIYVGADAREEQFKSKAQDYRILHLATHGLLNDRSPMYSRLLLAQTGEATGEDGLLEAWELMRLELKADLVVLSACETARGRISKGEGMIGLTWALFVAGAPTTVVSQWKVRSDSTAELMVEFHRQLKSRLSKSTTRPPAAEAMRAAALKIKKDLQYRHPFHWAGFIVMGAGN
jgi:CHAT domain-containing protein